MAVSLSDEHRARSLPHCLAPDLPDRVGQGRDRRKKSGDTHVTGAFAFRPSRRLHLEQIRTAVKRELPLGKWS